MNGISRSSVHEMIFAFESTAIRKGSTSEFPLGASFPGTMATLSKGVSTVSVLALTESKGSSWKTVSMFRTETGERYFWGRLFRLKCRQLRLGSMIPSIDAHDQVGARCSGVLCAEEEADQLSWSTV